MIREQGSVRHGLAELGEWETGLGGGPWQESVMGAGAALSHVRAERLNVQVCVDVCVC